jgi:hypothetical protein
MNMEERQQAQERFAKEVRILISTDAGGEGLNLQFCHNCINFDIPWNPMRLEQRIGRVDRIGQASIVRAINFLFENSVDFRVREVLEEKLAVIFHEFGVDKTSDVLDSVEAAHLFDDLYIQALLHPDRIPQSVQEVTEAIKTRANEASAKNAALAGEEALSADEAKAALNLPVGDWVERMTVNYLDAFGGKMEAELDCLRIQWPGESQFSVFYLPSQSGAAPANADLLRLDHPKVRGLLSRLPRFVPGIPIPLIRFASFPANIAGIWSLWEIKIVTHDRHRRRMMPLFVHEDGRVLVPTARFLWEQLCAESWKLDDADSVGTTEQSFPACEKLALEQSRDIYFEIRQRHYNQITLENEKMGYSFKIRRKMLQNIGLQAVRDFRLRKLAQEEAEWAEEMKRQSQVMPELTPLLMLRVG